MGEEMKMGISLQQKADVSSFELKPLLGKGCKGLASSLHHLQLLRLAQCNECLVQNVLVCTR